jgi:hypothetical protein
MDRINILEFMSTSPLLNVFIGTSRFDPLRIIADEICLI